MSLQKQLRQEILARFDMLSYFEGKLNQKINADGDGWSQKLLCCFHSDTRPSLNVNIKSGGFKCHSCPGGEIQGSLFDFHCLINQKDHRDKTNFRAAFIELGTLAGVDMTEFIAGKLVEKIADTGGAPAIFQPKADQPLQDLNKADAADMANQPIKLSVAQKYHEALQEHHYKFLSEKRGLTLGTIQRRKLGFDEKAISRNEDNRIIRGRYTIPVFGKGNRLRNIRKYAPDADPVSKVLNTKGFGSPPRLYPLPELLHNNWQHVIICEGELDCIIVNQKLEECGLSSTWGAVTGTHGCGTWLPEWLDFMYDRNVYFCFDCDVPGKAAASSITTRYFLTPMMQGRFKSVKIVILPLDGSKDYKDLTDFFLKTDYNIEHLVKLIQDTPALEAGGIANDEATVPPVEVESLVDAIKDRRYIDRRISVPLSISGQTSKTYHAVREYKVSYCPAKDDCCSREAGIRNVPYGHESFIASCMSSKVNVMRSLQCIACTGDKKPVVEAKSKVVMEEFFAHQVVERWRTEENPETGHMENVQELTTVPVYVLQPEVSIKVKPQNYMATGWVRSHPASQQATLFIEHLEPMEDDWLKFEVNEETLPTLKRLKELSVRDIRDDLTNNVTRIYESDEILMTILLTFLSPLRFVFDGELIRGWINSCVIGDSGTGKSATYGRIADWLDLGDRFSALTGARTGLLYAVKTKNSEWYVHVGSYVMASQRIIAIDEAQESPIDEIKKMAIAMDEGWLRVDQVAQGGYSTQTRLTMLMNPKHNKKISDFSCGCLALTECFAPMFIRRLDMAVFCTAREDHGFYNQKFTGGTTTKVTKEDFRQLVYWAWTRKPDDILFSEEAVLRCLEVAQELSGKFGHCDDIPLVDPQSCRKKIARLATAYAILSRNFTDDFTGVTVTDKHVNVMAKFIDVIYSSPACNLLQHSKHKKNKNTLTDYPKIKDNFEAMIKNARFSSSLEYREANYLCQLLLLLQESNGFVRLRDLKEQLTISMKWVQRHMAVLRSFNMVEISRGFYKTTAKFNKFMLQWQQETGVEAMLDTVHAKIGERSMMQDNSDEWADRANDSSGGDFDDLTDYDSVTGEPVKAVDPNGDPYQ